VNQEGRYEITSLIPGVQSYIQAEAEGYGAANTEMSTLVGGEEKDLGDLTLPKADSFLAGAITDTDGQPIAGVQVYVYGGTYTQTVTGAEGKYRLDNLVRGRVQVNLQHPDYYDDYQSDVQTGVENLDFMLMRKAAPPRKAAQVGAPAPELAVSRWLNGEAKLSNLRGRVVLLAFCPAYSPAGRDLLPQLQALHEQHGAAGLTVVQVVDGSATPEELETFVREAHLTYPFASVEPASSLGWGGQTFGDYGVESVPAVFLIDKQGMLRYADVAEGLEEKVKGLLAE
jgi:peroxiredoxin